MYANYLEARNATLYTLRDHDENLRRFRATPGRTREDLVGNVIEMGAEPWTFEEGPWF